MPTSDAGLDRRELKHLALENTRFTGSGFSLDLGEDPSRWDALLRRLGEESYDLLARELCREYRRLRGREFLFSESCVAWELKYHITAYLWARGYSWRRHITTWLLPRRLLIRHCRSVDISAADARNPAQRLMFGYQKGVRKQYRGTRYDPFA